ncbi:TRAP transporter small permease subunit [Consotaella aegiceratis]|uniref:TRAP transporter small permease subunit n=1 Tax=Consotaella aegiceratis TaxID=3097961 RepID=UPI002F3FACF6
MRRSLATLYRLAGLLAAACLLGIASLVALQIAGRLVDWALVALGQRAFGFMIPSLAEICGFLLAGATFLALADTLAANVHIRVDLVAERLPAGVRRVVDGLVALLAAAIAGFATYALALYSLKSFEHGDVSYGMVRVPLALPQAAMTLGLLILTIALVEEAVLAFRGLTRHVHQDSAI